MIIEIKVPSPGESITEVEIGRWLVQEGELVTKGQEIAEVESDKATLTIIAEESGKLSITAKEGERVAVGSVACSIDTSATGPDIAVTATTVAAEKTGQKAAIPAQQGQSAPSESGGTPLTASVIGDAAGMAETPLSETELTSGLKITAVAREMMKENNLSIDELISGLKRIGKREVETVLQMRQSPQPFPVEETAFSRSEERVKMTALRRKLSERLVSVKNETAMLTTFNEVDMQPVMEMRKRYQQPFSEKHGLKLGFMAFFTKAVALAMKDHPAVNSQISGEEIVTPGYVDVGIAVQTPKGLMVPIVRNAESKSIAQIEQEIKELAEKARNKKITLSELSGGTFTITNGGVFGSLLSTPILNPPQSAILGMHNIVERPVAINGKVEIRPMMYVALSYDHRVIDGKDSVGFLVKVKELIENPDRMVTGGKDPKELLLGLI